MLKVQLQAIANRRSRSPWPHLADVAEPARTERILTRPYSVLKPCAADYIDGMSMTLMPKSSGKYFLGMAFNWYTLLIQVWRQPNSGLQPLP